jgi:hypothetical protein
MDTNDKVICKKCQNTLILSAYEKKSGHFFCPVCKCDYSLQDQSSIPAEQLKDEKKEVQYYNKNIFELFTEGHFTGGGEPGTTSVKWGISLIGFCFIIFLPQLSKAPDSSTYDGVLTFIVISGVLGLYLTITGYNRYINRNK